MKKITPKSNDGETNPPGFSIETTESTKVGQISFPERRTRALLSPLVEAYLEDKNKKLLIRAVVFIAPDENAMNFTIYQNWFVNIEGTPQLQFFICYDMKEIEGKDFDIYEVSFYAVDTPFGKNAFSHLKTIETFVWDVDPVTSRGTVTTVQDT